MIMDADPVLESGSLLHGSTLVTNNDSIQTAVTKPAEVYNTQLVRLSLSLIEFCSCNEPSDHAQWMSYLDSNALTMAHRRQYLGAWP